MKTKEYKITWYVDRPGSYATYTYIIEAKDEEEAKELFYERVLSDITIEDIEECNDTPKYDETKKAEIQNKILDFIFSKI